MIRSPSRFLVLGLALLLSCALISSAWPGAAVSAAASHQATTADAFAAQLMLALVERDGAELQGLMTDPFAIGYWRSEGVTLPPGVAVAELQSTLLVPGAVLAFDTNTNLTTLLDGTDPQTLWGPDVTVARTLYVTGLGAQRSDEAILTIAQQADGSFSWHGLLVAYGGFGDQAAAPTPTPNSPPGLAPTTVRAVRVLQDVNVRSGPGTQYSRIGRYATGQVVEVFGVHAGGSWWNVRCPNGSVGNCWVTAERGTTQPITQTGPTPTYTPAPPPNSATRIQFPPGGTAATVRGQVQAGGAVRYLLRALAGQQMTVVIVSPGGQANVAIQGVSDGQPYKRLENEARTFELTLPATQDYLLTVATAGPRVAYELQVTVVAVAPPPSQPLRIQFPPGGTSVSLNGLVRPPHQPRYVLRAQGGQEMTVQINSPGNLANFALMGVSDGQPYKRLVNEARGFALILPTTQDYLITVASAAGAVDFTLTVTVVWASSPPPSRPSRVTFAPGATAASVSGKLVSGGRQDYLVRALAGQQMTVELYADTDDTLLAITGNDGTPFKRGTVGGPTFRFTLPTTQDYIVSVIAAEGGASYTLVVTID